MLGWPMRRRQAFSGVAIPWRRNSGRWMAASASGLRQGRDLLTGQGDQDGAGAWGEGEVEAAVRSDEDLREVVRTTGDELRSRRAAEAETGVGARWTRRAYWPGGSMDETRLGGGFVRQRQMEAVDSEWTDGTAGQLPGCQPGCWDLELHLGPVLGPRQLGPNRTSGWAAGQQRGRVPTVYPYGVRDAVGLSFPVGFGWRKTGRERTGEAGGGAASSTKLEAQSPVLC